MAIPDISVQARFLEHFKKIKSKYKEEFDKEKDRFLDIYEEVISTETPKLNAWESSYKVNKCRAIEEKWVSKLLSREFRPLVSPRIERFDDIGKAITTRDEDLKKAIIYARNTQDYISYLYSEYGFQDAFRKIARNLVRYGVAYSDIVIKDVWERKMVKGKMVSRVVGKRPEIEVMSWADMYIDPRFPRIEDMPGVVRVRNGVRYDELKRNKDLFNLDQINELSMAAFSKDIDGYKRRLFEVSGIYGMNDKQIDKDSIAIDEYYGYFREADDKQESIFKVTIVNEEVIIGYEEIEKIPFIDGKAFDNTETYYGSSPLTDVISLQKELNFQKNAQNQVVRNGLNTQRIWVESSGINPKKLLERNQIIPSTATSGEQALAGIPEIPYREVSSSYFQNMNDLERQIQEASFTVDTSNPIGQQTLLKTATGVKQKATENNIVVNQVLKQFEEMAGEIFRRVIDIAYETSGKDIIFRSLDAEEFVTMNREQLKDARKRYDMRVEAGSSSMMTLEDRLDQENAIMQNLIQLKQLGEPVNLRKPMENMLMNMERKDIESYFVPPEQPEQQQPQGQPQVEEAPVQETEGSEFAPPGVDIDQNEFATPNLQ